MESNSSHHSTLFFNTIISFYILIYLYFPNLFLKSIISPILISTLILLLFILRLATSQQQQEEQSLRLELESEPELNPPQYFKDDDLEWTVWGPLEVIHEGEEGEDEEIQFDKGVVSEKYGSLSRYYPETESDTDTDTSSSYSLDEDCLEIALDYEFDDKREGSVMNKLLNREVDEEDNLIEIDISPNKTDDCGFIW